MGEALLAIEAENPLTYTFAGAEYPCSRGDASSAKTLGYGGYNGESDLILVVRNEAIPGGLSEKSQITVEGRGYLLDNRQQDPNGVFQVWSLSDPDKAA